MGGSMVAYPSMKIYRHMPIQDFNPMKMKMEGGIFPIQKKNPRYHWIAFFEPFSRDMESDYEANV